MWLPRETYAARRRAVIERIGVRAAALLPAAPVATRSNDVEYRYRQDSDFLYLTGFNEPEAACLLVPGHPQGEFVLFVRPRDPERERWTGHRAGVEGAVQVYGADVARPIEELDQTVRDYLADRDQLFYAFGRDAGLNEKVTRWVQHWRQARPRTGRGPLAVLDPSEIIHEMRVVKQAPELEAMREAAAITAQAHRAAMTATRPGMHEYEVEALLDYTFRRHGASGPAYPSIVAGGANATILHYTENDQRLGGDQLLLIDAGAEYRGYCADVTRTFPVGASFSKPQRQVYEIVLRAQEAAIAVIRPGVAVDAPHQRAVEVLVEGMLTLGVLQGEKKEIIASETYRRFFMHRTSHWLGMDVHDAGSYKIGDDFRALEPGMVLTVEPGVYFAVGSEGVDPQYHGIGVRIEDDVLVTSTGHEVLTAGIPKDPNEIESIRSDRF